jgi:DNA-binding response OmpR family regulator
MTSEATNEPRAGGHDREQLGHAGSENATGGPRMRVLMIDDDRNDQILIGRAMRRLAQPACELETVGTLAAGLERLASGEIEALLLDLQLPGVAGLDGLDQVRGRSDIPVVVLTGRDDEAMARQALRNGAQDYLVKGRVTDAALGRAIQYAFERADGERSRREMAALRAVHNLSLAASHEINNPLAIIMGYLQLLERSAGADVTLIRRIASMKEAAVRIRDVITFMGQIESLTTRGDWEGLPVMLDIARSAGIRPLDERLRTPEA